MQRKGLLMRTPVEAVLLRVFLAEEDRYEGQSLYKIIVETALKQRMAGATVLPGPNGFGISRSARTELNVDARQRGPIVIEIVDTEEKISQFLPVLGDMVQSGLLTLEKVRAIRYRRHDSLEPSTRFGQPTPE
jgi:uncharacterized protein